MFQPPHTLSSRLQARVFCVPEWRDPNATGKCFELTLLKKSCNLGDVSAHPAEKRAGFGRHDRGCLYERAAHIIQAGTGFFPAPPFLFHRGATLSLVQLLLFARRVLDTTHTVISTEGTRFLRAGTELIF